ncbi:MAG TPA: class I SAM-dependent methyltransferase [Longimicrobium sp.]|nr:class I SAM-dependent methyltransferase [Longimicrobium sp.]
MSPASLLRNARDTARLLAARRRVAGMLRRATGDTVPLLRAVEAALRGDASAEERAWMERIERLRRRLLAIDLPLTLVDYGAGAPELALSAEEMYAGRAVTRTLAEVCRGGSKPPFWAGVLFHLVRQVRPASCVELGTCLGISAAYQAAALGLNGRGRMTTLEGAEKVAELAGLHLEELGLDGIATVVTGRFQDTLAEVLRERAPVDYAFIDGHHDEHATLGYFGQIHPHLAESALVVFDDVAWSAGMRRAWTALQADERIRTVLDLGAVGVGVTGPASIPKQHLRLPLG